MEHLVEQKARIERIERGEEVQSFRIAPPSDEADERRAGTEVKSPASAGDFQPATSSSDEDIPF
jgi:hypothetical protein